MSKFNKLSRAEMKFVMGGLVQPPAGGGCYTCTISYSNGSTISGPSCGTDFQNAQDNLTTNILNHPGTYGSPSGWGCSEIPYAS